MIQNYYVRDLPLHKVIVDGEGRKTTQPHKPHSKVELTSVEAIRYQHLIETEAQYKSRQPKTKKDV